uniref:FHA domain-containing protein n=1 Tax=Glossina austeni TaxID=7395 RepID=A0A1A9VU12_GLOAU
MSLESAKLIRLDEAGNQCETIVANGRKLTLGYYMSCDYVLTDPRAKGVHCEIECDALGRVFIHNFCEEYPVHLNGFPISIKRTLLSGSKLLILDTLFEWEFQSCINIENEAISMQKTTSTPQRQIGVPEQSANSCPDLKPHREVIKRLTIHNFVHCIRSCGEGNAEGEPFETRNVSYQVQDETDQQEGQEIEASSKENEDHEKFANESRTQHLLQVPLTFAEENPRMDIIMCTENKANKSTQENKRLLAMCRQSHVLITSYSPRQTGVCIEKSFTSLYTSRSGCGTPKSVNDLINFCTPSTSKNATIMNSVAASNQSTTMHLVDLTATTKEMDSYLKASASKKNLTQKSSKAKLASSDITDVAVSHFTPLSNDSQKDSSATPDSVASVITVSSTDSSSVVAATPRVSFPRLSKKTTSKRTNEVDHLDTPKRTTQSLIRRVLQSSAKNQAYKGRNNIDYVTPARNVKGNAVYVVNPKSVEPERSCNAKLLARSCLTTPSHKNVIKSDHDLDNCIASTSQGARKSIFNPLSGTSTPLLARKNCSMARERMPSHKVRNFIKVTQRSPLTNNNFTAKFSSNKKKSPQTYLSERLVLRARKSLNNKCPTTRSRKLCTVVKEKSTPKGALPDMFEKTLLINSTEKNVNNSSDELSRIFIIDSNKNTDEMHNMKLNKDGPQARNCFEKIKNFKVIISEQEENEELNAQSRNCTTDNQISKATPLREQVAEINQIIGLTGNESSWLTFASAQEKRNIVIVDKIGDELIENYSGKSRDPINKIEGHLANRGVDKKIENSHAKIEAEEGANISMGMEDASKLLLQEIEIVLNKSDEFQQKHLESKSTIVEKAPYAVENKELEENEPTSLTKLASKKSLTSIDNQELRETTSVISLLDNNQGQASFAGKCKTELLSSTGLRVCEQKEKSEIVPFLMERCMENTSENCMEIMFSMSPTIAKEKPKKTENVLAAENTSKISEIQSFPAPCVAETGILSPLFSHLNEKADKTQLIAFTPRRSVICASLSLKNSVGLTSNTQRNRRASCTAINELFLTPRINTRRLSISLEDEKTVANLQMSRADTAQEFFNVEHLNIPLEMSEDMGAVVGENENVENEKEKSHTIKESSALIAETICTSEEVICDIFDETVENFTRDAKTNINQVNVKDMGEQQSAADMGQSSGEPKHVAEEILTKNSEVLDNSDYGYGNELDESFNAETGSLIHLNNKSEEVHKGEAVNIHENELESVPSNMNNVRVIANLLKTRTPTNANNNEEVPCTSREFLDSLKEVKQLLKNPASYRTVHSSDIREQINVPKRCSIPPLSDLNESLDTFEKNVKLVTIDNVETYQNLVMDKNFDKFLVTPRAKNLMIAGLPSSSVVGKTGNSVKIPTAECDFSISKNDNALFDDLFKTPAAGSCLIGSYFEADDEQVEQRESSSNINKVKENFEMKQHNHEPSKKLFEEHVQEIKIYTPISTEWKSLTAQIPTQKSLFSASEILSDLSRCNVKEWVEPAKNAETSSKMLKHDYQVDTNEDLSTKDTTPGVTCSYTSLYLPLTKCVMDVTNTSDVMLDISSTSQSNLTDPLAGTSIVEFANKHECSSASLDSKGDISGIHLLDKTTESMSDEQAIDSERDEQVSTFSLQTIDDGKVNELSELLMVTDSEDFSMLHESSPNRTGCQLLDKTTHLTKQSIEEMGLLEDPERDREKKIVDCVSISSVFSEEEVLCKKALIVKSRKCASEEKGPKTVNVAAVFEGTLAKDDCNISEEMPVHKNVIVETIAGQIEIETGFCVKAKGREKTNAEFSENASSTIESSNSAKVDAKLLEETHCAQQEFETTKRVALPADSKLLLLEEKEQIAVLETDPITSPKTISVNALQASHTQFSQEKEKHPTHSAFPEVSPTYNETFLEQSQSIVEESIFLKRYSEAKHDCTKNHERRNSIFTLPGATCVTNPGNAEAAQQSLVLSTSVSERDVSSEMISMKENNERGQKRVEHLENSSTALIATQQAAYETMEGTEAAVSKHVNTMADERIFESKFAEKIVSREFEQEVSSTEQLVSKARKISEKDEKRFIDAKEVEPLKLETSFESAWDNKVFLKEKEGFTKAQKDITNKLDEDFIAISLPKTEILISDIADKKLSTIELPEEVRCDTVLGETTTIKNVDFLENSKTLNERQLCKTAVIEIDPIASVKHVNTNEVKTFNKKICPVKGKPYAKVFALPTANSSHIETFIDSKDPQIKLQEGLSQRNSKASGEDTEKQESNGDISVGIKPLDVILSSSIGDRIIEANKLETANMSQVQDKEFEELFVRAQQFDSLDEAAEETVSAEVLLTKRTGERVQKMREYLDNAGMSAEVIENARVDRSSHITNTKEEFIVERKFTEERKSESEIAQVYVATEKSEIASKPEGECIVRNLNVPGIQAGEALLTDVQCRGRNMDERVSDNAADIVEMSSIEGPQLSNSQKLELVTIEIFSSEKNAAGNLTEIIEISETAKESGSKIFNSSTPPFNKIEENKTGGNLKCEIITIQTFKKSVEKKPEIEKITKLNVINQSESVDHEKTDSEKQTKADKLLVYKENTSVTDNELKSGICEVVVIDSDFETKSNSSIKQTEENHSKDEAKAGKGSQFNECSDANPDLVSTKRAVFRTASAPQERIFTTSESNKGSTSDNNDGNLATTHKTRRKLSQTPLEEPIAEQAETKELSFLKVLKDKTPDIKDVEHALVKELPTITTVKSMSMVEGEHEPLAISEPKWNKKCSDHTEQLSFNIAHMAGASAEEPAIVHNQTPVKDIQFVSTDPTMVTLRSTAIRQASKRQPTHPSPSTLDIEITYHEMKEVQKTPRKRELKHHNVSDSSHSSITNVDDPPTRARTYRDFQKEDNITIDSEVVNESGSDEKEFTQQQNQNINLKTQLFAMPKKNAVEEVKAIIVSEKANQSEVKINENLDTSSKRPLRRKAARRVLNEETTIEGNQRSKRRKPLESKLREVANVSSKSTTGIATETGSSEVVDTDLQKDTNVIELQSHSRTANARQKPSEKQESCFSSSMTTTKRRTGKRKVEEKQQLLKDTARQIKSTVELEMSGTTSIAIDMLEITSRSNDLKVSDEQATFQSRSIIQTFAEVNNKPVREHEESQHADDEIELTFKTKKLKNLETSKLRLVEIEGIEEPSDETAQKAGLLRDSQIGSSQCIGASQKALGSPGINRAKLVSETESIQSSTDETKISVTKRPQRKAATAYHNYDETSDTEMQTLTKEKHDNSQKLLAANMAEVLAEHNQGVIRTEMAIGVVTTTRGRMRKPTPKVQQFLEKERAKAESPKKRNVRSTGTPAEQRKPGRRGRKPSINEMRNAESDTRKSSKRSRGRAVGEFSATITSAERPIQETPATVADVQSERSVESVIMTKYIKKSNKSPTETSMLSAVKSRRRGRAKGGVEQFEAEEFPRKKVSSTFEYEKQKGSTPTSIVETHKPKRNAAAAAKARIEEDALAAAAIDPPKKSRAKRTASRTPIADVRDFNTEVDEDKCRSARSTTKEKRQILAATTRKRDYRLASASTVGSTDEFADVEGQIGEESAGYVNFESEVEKPATKREARNRTAALVNDTPVVPVKRIRKGKSRSDDAGLQGEPGAETKETTRTARARKIVHFEHATEIVGLLGEIAKTPGKETSAKQPPQRLSFTTDNETGNATSRSQQSSLTLPAEALLPKRSIRTRRK